MAPSPQNRTEISILDFGFWILDWGTRRAARESTARTRRCGGDPATFEETSICNAMSAGARSGRAGLLGRRRLRGLPALALPVELEARVVDAVVVHRGNRPLEGVHDDREVSHGQVAFVELPV